MKRATVWATCTACTRSMPTENSCPGHEARRASFFAEARTSGTGRVQSNLVDQLADTVKITLGPKGRNVLIDKAFMPPLVTNDGVTIAKEIQLEDDAENLGAQLVKEVATKTNNVTATLLAQIIIKEGFKNVAAGANPMGIKRGIQGAVDVAVKEIIRNSESVETKESIAQVASVSAADEEIGGLIGEAMEKVLPRGESPPHLIPGFGPQPRPST